MLRAEMVSTTAESAAPATGRRSEGESEQVSSTPDARGSAAEKTAGVGNTRPQPAAPTAGCGSKGEWEQIGCSREDWARAASALTSQVPMTAAPSLPGDPFCSPVASHWPRWLLGSWRCKLKTPSTGRSPCGTGLLQRQSLPQSPKRWMMGARCTNGVPSKGSIGRSCRRCSIASSLPSVSGGTLDVRRAPTVTLRQPRWNRCRRACAALLRTCTS